MTAPRQVYQLTAVCEIAPHFSGGIELSRGVFGSVTGSGKENVVGPCWHDILTAKGTVELAKRVVTVASRTVGANSLGQRSQRQMTQQSNAFFALLFIDLTQQSAIVSGNAERHIEDNRIVQLYREALISILLIKYCGAIGYAFLILLPCCKRDPYFVFDSVGEIAAE